MTLIKNKTAGRDYKFLKKYEAGIQLAGFEVKSLREKKGSLKGAYIAPRGGEAFLVGAHIPPFQPKNAPEDYDANRSRKLLLHKEEIRELAAREKEGGIAIVPIKLYNNSGKIKLSLAVSKGKKKHDKREDIKKRDTKRDIERTLKNKYR